MEIVADFETFYDKANKYSLSTMSDAEYVTDPRFYVQSLSLKVDDQPKEFLRADEIEPRLQQLFSENDDITWIAHNNYFDAFVLVHHYKLRPEKYLCTMCFAKAMWPGHNASLKKVAERMWPNNEEMRKTDELVKFDGSRKLSEEQYDAMRSYNDNDTELCYQIYRALKPHMPKNELKVIDLTIKMYVEPKIVADMALLEQTAADAEKEQQSAIDQAYKFIQSRVKDKYLLASQDHRGDMTLKKHEQQYRETYGFKPIRHDDEYRKFLSTSDKFTYILENYFSVKVPLKLNDKNQQIPALSKADVAFVELKAERPELKTLWDGREHSKSNIAKSRAVTMLKNAEALNGLLPMPLKYYNALTGRYGGFIYNPQNFQRGSNHRKALTAPDGYYLYVVDSSNIEGRFSAWFCGDVEKLKFIRDGGDIYVRAAQSIYSCSANEIDDIRRSVGKATELGCGYGMGKDRFRDFLNAGPLGAPPIYLEDTADYARTIYAYRDLNYLIVAMWRELDELLWAMSTVETLNRPIGPKNSGVVAKYQHIKLPSGLSLYYDDLNMDKNGDFTYWNGKARVKMFGGKLLENIIQALARIAVCEQMLAINDLMVEHGGRVVLQVHDEVISMAPSYGTYITSADNAKKTEISGGRPELVHKLQKQTEDIMSTPPVWASDLPLAAKGDFHTRYIK